MKINYKSLDKSYYDGTLTEVEALKKRQEAIKEQLVQVQPSGASYDGKNLSGFSLDLLRDLKYAVQDLQELRKGDKDRAARDITLGMYFAEKYGIATDENGSSARALALLGVNMKNHTLADLTKLQFTANADMNANYRWLIGETVTEAIRAGVFQSRALWRELIASNELVPYDSVKIPVYKNPNGFMKTVREGESMKVGNIEFDEIALEAKDVGCGFVITDKLARNIRLNILSAYFQGATGVNLNRQLTKEAINRLINGNQLGVDGAPVVGVVAPGSFDYDNDWLEIILAMGELGYFADMVVGSRSMIKEAMALPEFKGFDGSERKANIETDLPMPSDYRFRATGAMPKVTPSGGQLLFLDTRQALRHYYTKPITLESDRDITKLQGEFYASMTTLFAKWNWDASIILDSTLKVATNPFPAIIDSETYDNESFD